MPKLKSFRQLSQRQKNRRLNQRKNPPIRESLVEESSPEQLNQNLSVEFINGEIDYDTTSPVDEANSDSSPEVVTGLETASISESEIGHLIDRESISSEEENTVDIGEDSSLLNRQPLSLRSKLILWTDENKVELKTLTSLLRILKNEGHDDLPSDARTLMKTPRQTEVHQRSGGQYYHYGLEKGIANQLDRLETSNIQSPILINVNIDGLPLSKSSKSQLWPVLAQIFINETTTPFIVGAYHGYTKPSTDENFLTHFVEEYKELNRKGLEYQNKVYRVEIRAVICDSPARAFVSCTKGHNGYFGCSKCIVEGDYENNRMLFLDGNCTLRTDESFRLRLNPEHHTGTSPFESIPFPMVTHFTLDYMHLVLLGVVKKLLRLWLRGSTNMEARLSAAQIRQLSGDMAALKAYIPCEFVRVPTSLEELDRWKATEFRMFNVVVRGDWCATVPSSWVDSENKSCSWPPKGTDLSKAIRKNLCPNDSWEVIAVKYILGPYESYATAKEVEKGAIFLSSDDAKFDAFQNSQPKTLPPKRDRKQKKMFGDDSDDCSRPAKQSRKKIPDPPSNDDGRDLKNQTRRTEHFDLNEESNQDQPSPSPKLNKTDDQLSEIDRNSGESDAQTHNFSPRRSKTDGQTYSNDDAVFTQDDPDDPQEDNQRNSKVVKKHLNKVEASKNRDRALPIIKSVEVNPKFGRILAISPSSASLENRHCSSISANNNRAKSPALKSPAEITPNNKAAENEGALNINDSAIGKYLIRIDRKLDQILGLLDSDDRAAAIEDSIDLLPEFPLSSVKAFVKFTKELAEDRELRRKFQSKVRKIGGKSGEAHLTNALVMTMTNSLGKKLTWDGQRATRGIKDTTFANIIIGTVASQNTTTSQSALTRTFSEWLRRAGDRYRYHLKSGRET